MAAAARLSASRAVALLKTVPAPAPVPAVGSRLAPESCVDADARSSSALTGPFAGRPPPPPLPRVREQLREIGRGGQGVVYEVSSLVPPAAGGGASGAASSFALKCVRARRSHAGDVSPPSLLRETRVMSRLAAHANVLKFYASWVTEAESESEDERASDGSDDNDDDDEDDDESESTQSQAACATRGGAGGSGSAILHILLELAAGDLARRLASGPSMSRDERSAVRVSLAAGLAHIHAHGVAHRDVKPANMLRARDDERVWKVADFGLAIERAEATHARAGVGTHIYSDPTLLPLLGNATRASTTDCAHEGEESTRDAPVSVWPALLAADIYAAGVIMLELAYPVATAMERAAVLSAHRANGALPRALAAADEALVRWLTRPLASERPSAAVLAAHLSCSDGPSADSPGV